MDELTKKYAERLSRMIQKETVSDFVHEDITKFREFQELLKELFPNVFSKLEIEDFDGSLLLKWKGKSSERPFLFMNHQDVVEATGEWTEEPFSGKITEDKIWGRGTLDDKGGLWAMLQAAEELLEAGYVPERDIYFETACTEETDGIGADTISQELLKRGIKFELVLDEGGMILYDPVGLTDGTYAMIGVGEKCAVDLKFTAKSLGGHASTPGKNTPLVRLGKFMAEVEKKEIFDVEMAPAIHEMFGRMSGRMKQPLKFLFGHHKLFGGLIKKIVPKTSATAAALFKTTLAFTMASGSEGRNVLPREAYVIGNMRTSHHQGKANSIETVKKLAAKFDIDVEVLEGGFESPITDFNSAGFKKIEEAVRATFEGVIPAPYLMTGASDSKYFSRVCDSCIRFCPFEIDNRQLVSIHGKDENLDLKTLVPAVEFYKYLMKNM